MKREFWGGKMMMDSKQVVLKPQDMVVALKLALHRGEGFGLAELAAELRMPLSSMHGSVQRCELARLASRSAGSIRAIRPSIREFAISGVKYAFPGKLGAVTQGVPTSVGGPTLKHLFDASTTFTPVWPSAVGESRGPGVVPLHRDLANLPSDDEALYDVLTLVDALRIGAARERELAEQILMDRLS